MMLYTNNGYYCCRSKIYNNDRSRTNNARVCSYKRCRWYYVSCERLIYGSVSTDGVIQRPIILALTRWHASRSLQNRGNVGTRTAEPRRVKTAQNSQNNKASIAVLVTEQFYHGLQWCVLVTDTVRMKMADFWDVAPCSLVEAYRRFRGANCLHHEDDDSVVMESGLTVL
jgi:hypothetical protein